MSKLVSVNGKVTNVPSSFLGKSKSVEVYEKLNRLGEGTYGIVYRAKDTSKNQIVALKKIRMEQELDGIPLSSIREILFLTSLNHVNIVRVNNIVIGTSLNNILLELEYCTHDLSILMEKVKEPYNPSQGIFLHQFRLTNHQVKCLMKQLLKGMEYLHANFIVHRDIKLSNLLLNKDGILKIADFGLARNYGIPPKAMTPKVVTLWYRAPELFFNVPYNTAVDMWSVGCIFGEFILHRPLLPGKSELDQVVKICDLLGPPSKKIWPDFDDTNWNYGSNKYNKITSTFSSWSGWSRGVKELLNGFFAYDPKQRMTATEALESDYFYESPKACKPEELPTHPEMRNDTR